MAFTDAIALAARLMEGAGIVVMIAGTVVALVLSMRERRRGTGDIYRTFRTELGRAILLGLDPPPGRG